MLGENLTWNRNEIQGFVQPDTQFARLSLNEEFNFMGNSTKESIVSGVKTGWFLR